MNSADSALSVDAGVGLRPAHYDVFLREAPRSVGWIEVISENFMPWKGRPLGAPFRTLQRLRQSYPVSLHGVSMNIGSADDLDMDYLERLKILVESIDPLIVSDHLSWTGVQGQNLHDLIPLPYNLENLQLIVTKLDRVQEVLRRPVALENPSSYLEFVGSDMTEPEFISELVKRSGCHLLLDINNVFVNSQNLGFDPKGYLKSLPAASIVQIHLAGHSIVDGFRIDTHDSDVCSEVWDLYGWFLENVGSYRTMIERDGNIPDWAGLEREVLKLNSMRRLV